MTAGNIEQQLEETGHLTVPYPDDIRTHIPVLMKKWRHFCNLPTDVKERFSIGDNDLNELGYRARRGSFARGDWKEFFHITPPSASFFEQIAKRERDAMLCQFFSQMDIGIIAFQIMQLLRPLVLELTYLHSLMYLTPEVLTNAAHYTFRFIRYPQGMVEDDGCDIAHAHVDKSGLTLHLHESCGGLESFWNGSWSSMPVSASQTVILPGLALQHRTKCGVKAVCHRVRNSRDARASGRYALVCFIPLMNSPVFDPKKGGRLQEKEPGFNYDMSFEELDAMFRER